MSVLIKGIEMPKNCDSCPCYYETEGAWRDECQVLRKECAISEERPSWCPLVPVPPHGRLIDADALMYSDGDLWDGMWGYSGMEIMSAPTIIPAEGGAE